MGEFGARLSGGERQRIAFARAIYRDPEILILDVATSSLDSKSESVILDLLKSMVASGKTVIVIAHRLQTIRKADNILVLEKGELVEKGKHDELLSNNGHYAMLWKNLNT